MLLLILLLLFVDDLIARFSGNETCIQGYADDIFLPAVGKFPPGVRALALGPTYCRDMVRRGRVVG